MCRAESTTRGRRRGRRQRRHGSERGFHLAAGSPAPAGWSPHGARPAGPRPKRRNAPHRLRSQRAAFGAALFGRLRPRYVVVFFDILVSFRASRRVSSSLDSSTFSGSCVFRSAIPLANYTLVCVEDCFSFGSSSQSQPRHVLSGIYSLASGLGCDAVRGASCGQTWSWNVSNAKWLGLPGRF